MRISDDGNWEIQDRNDVVRGDNESGYWTYNFGTRCLRCGVLVPMDSTLIHDNWHERIGV